MLELGLETRVDAAGNLFGRLSGTDRNAPVVLSGSHIDTVRNGGKYDGALGVHAAIAAVKAILASGMTPKRTIEVVALCEEEGSRFTSPLWGTQAILGRIPPEAPSQLLDADEVSMAEAMGSVGLDSDRLPDAARSDIGNFVELHIEQGGILEADGVALGVVEVITGQRHFKIAVSGTQNHAGTGAVLVSAESVTRFEPFAVESVDTTAAGDAFTGHLAAGLAQGLGIVEAIRRAMAAGALAVTKRGASPSLPSREAVESFLQG